MYDDLTPKKRREAMNHWRAKMEAATPGTEEHARARREYDAARAAHERFLSDFNLNPGDYNPKPDVKSPG